MAKEITLTESAFLGLDSATDAATLLPGYVSVCDNLNFEPGGGNGISLRTRPGMRGLLTSAMGSTIREALPIIRTDSGFEGQRWVLLVAGNSTTAKVYAWRKDTTTAPTNITPSGVNFDARKVQFHQFGAWIFISGSLDGKLYRYKFPNALVEAATGLTRPTKTITATATNTPLVGVSTSNWRSDNFGVSASLTIPESDFANGSVTPIAPGSDLDSTNEWQVTGGINVECQLGTQTDDITGTNLDPIGGAGVKFVQMDDPGSSILTNNFIALPDKVNAYDTSSTRKALHLAAKVRYFASRTTDSILMTIYLYDSGGNLLGEQTQAIQSNIVGYAIDAQVYFSFGEYAELAPDKIKVAFTAGSDNITSTPGTTGPYFTDVGIKATVQAFGYSFNGSGGGYVDFVVNGLTDSFLTTPAPADLLLGGNRLIRSFTAGVDFQNYTGLSVPVALYTAIDETSFRVRLGFKQGLSDAPVWSSEGQLETATNGKRYLYFDLSDIDNAERDTTTDYFVLEFLTDLRKETGSFAANAAAFGLGPLVWSGGSPSTGGNAIEYLYLEATGTGATRIVSSSSPLSNSITVDPLNGTGRAVIQSGFPANTPASGTKILWYRRGGNFTDGLWRLIAEVPADADAGNILTDHYSWDASEGVLLDALAFEELYFAEVLTDHTPAPFSTEEPALAVGSRGARLVAVTPKAVYVGQLTDTEGGAGLYWGSSTPGAGFVSSVNSPNFVLEGWVQYFRNAPGIFLDPSLGQVPRVTNFRTWTPILFPGALYVLTGEDASDMKLTRFQGDEGKGAVSHRAVTVENNRLTWLAEDGLRAWDGSGFEQFGSSTVQVVSGRLERLLNPAGAFSGASLPASLYALSFFWSVGRRFYLATARTSSSTALDAVFVQDRRIRNEDGGAFTRWLISVTGAWSWPGEDFFYVADAGGMIYRMGANGEYGDRASAGASVTAVPWSLRSRRYVEGSALLRAHRFSATFSTTEAITLTWAVEGDSATSARDKNTWTTGTGGEQSIPRQSVAGNAEGRGLSWELSASSVQPFSIRDVFVIAGLTDRL